MSTPNQTWAGNLPNVIPPMAMPLGVADKNGTVTISQQWYLLLYNLSQQGLGQGGNAIAPLQHDFLNVIDAESQATAAYSLAIQGAQSLPFPISPGGASPYIVTAPSRGMFLVSGGVVTAISVTRDTFTWTIPITFGAPFSISGGDVLTVTWTVAPNIFFIPL